MTRWFGPCRRRPAGLARAGSHLAPRDRDHAGPERVTVTAAAAALLRDLRAQRGRGPLMVHQSGGCCDGSAPMCYPAGEFLTGHADARPGDLDIAAGEPVPVWMSHAQFGQWSRRLLVRPRLFTDAECAELDAAGDVTPPAGPQPPGG